MIVHGQTIIGLRTMSILYCMHCTSFAYTVLWDLTEVMYVNCTYNTADVVITQYERRIVRNWRKVLTVLITNSEGKSHNRE